MPPEPEDDFLDPNDDPHAGEPGWYYNDEYWVEGEEGEYDDEYPSDDADDVRD